MIGPPPAGGHHKLQVLIVPAGTAWHRIVHRRHGTALHVGKEADARWNDPEGRYGVLYLADAVETAFAETFGHDTPQRHPPLAEKFVDRLELGERLLYRVTCHRALRIALLQGEGLARLNLDVGLLATIDYALLQRWSRWVYASPEALDGIRYP